MPVRFLDDAFLAGAVRRFRVAAAFFPAAIRFGDLRVLFLAVVPFLVGAFRAVVRFRRASSPWSISSRR